MSDDELLIRHAAAWAGSKKRPLDADLLADVLELRRINDELPDGAWPVGSAERLLLVTWPAYGPLPPDIGLLGETLDTFWGFLRATGRMSAGSATPAELRKEAKRSLPKMAAAYDDPARHSQGRVLGDFGRSIGIDLDGAADIEELRGRLAAVQDAWNALPQEERIRLMPDPSPKSARGAAWTALVNGTEKTDDLPFQPGTLSGSARAVRESSYARQCFALADWVGAGREVTQAGILRPVVAREAYQALDLWPWERELDRRKWTRRGHAPPDDAEVDRMLAESALHAWRSAGDCLPLDRLWYPAVAAGLVEVGSRRATKGSVPPATDEGWCELGGFLFYSLAIRLGEYTVEPAVGLLSLPGLAQRPVPLAEVREWWEEQCPAPLRNFGALGWADRLDIVMWHLDDCGVFTMADDEISVTEFGRDCAVILTRMFEERAFDEYY